MNIVENLITLHPPLCKRLSYGTAGFRDRHDLPLDSIFYRMGILAYLRSKVDGSSELPKCVGVMITASHNAEIDNGVKVVDSDGGMLAQSWEAYAESIANAANSQEFSQSLVDAINSAVPVSHPGIVIIGRDTRSHSPALSNHVRQGISDMNGLVFDLGEVTTPQLHYVVKLLNESSSLNLNALTQDDVMKCLDNYYETMISGYRSLCKSSDNDNVAIHRVIVDCACGVGAIAAKVAKHHITHHIDDLLHIEVRNDVGSGPVNDACGAEYVQKNQLPPCGVSEQDEQQLLCSYDGDADRIVFHAYLPNITNDIKSSKWILYDGDKIAAVISLFLCQELKESGLASMLSMGVVQTAYANGASTKFLREHDIEVKIAKTGVKYLHHTAQQYDLGVYFEANGHGTVLLSDRFLSMLKEHQASSDVMTRAKLAIDRLAAFALTINQAVGDALSDMLVTIAALKILNLDIAAWNDLYTDFPSKQVKVPVPNKDLIVCSADETTVQSPSVIQEELNKCMASTLHGRCFIRPSGTEDVVRVYAEAATQELADTLAQQAITIVKAHLG